MRARWWTVSLLVAWPLGAHASDRVDALLEAAKVARGEGRLADALSALREAHDIEPHPVLLNNIGKLHEELGDYLGAHNAYARVADDPRADADLRSLDAKRVAALKPLLESGWVRPAPVGPPCRLDGRPLDRWTKEGPSGEIPVLPGLHVLEWGPVGNELLLRRLLAEGGKTIIMAEMRPTTHDVRIRLPSTPLSSLEIGGYRIATPLSDFAEVVAWSGAVDIRMTPEGRAPVAASFFALAGQVVELEGYLTVQQPIELPPPVVNTRPVWPWVVAGAGAVALGVGTGLFVHAESDRAFVRDKVENTPLDQPITGLTHREAVDIEDRTNIEAPAGLVVLSAGSAALITGLVGLILGYAL